MRACLQPAVEAQVDQSAAARAARMKVGGLRALTARHLATERKIEHAGDERHREERSQRLAFNEAGRESLGTLQFICSISG